MSHSLNLSFHVNESDCSAVNPEEPDGVRCSGLTHIPLLQVEKPFDTPAARATQGERTLTRLVSFKKSVRAEPVEA